MYDFSILKTKVKETENWLANEFSQIRTGRATPSMLDIVLIEAYGSSVPINQVASVSVEDAKTIRITPWDMSMAKAIEKGIILANLGVSVTLDEKGARVIFPSLTTETRTQFIKIAKQKLEDAKVAVRHERNKVNDDLQIKKKSGTMGEDDVMRQKNEMEKIIKEGVEKLEVMLKKKETEIMG